MLSHYRSELVERIRANGGVISSGDLTVKLAKEFGFCYGVERAIDLAYAARKIFSARPQPIYLLGEIIHNPEVNDQIRNMGIQIISPKPTDEEMGQLQCGRRGHHSRLWHRSRHAQEAGGQGLRAGGHDLRRRDERLETRAPIFARKASRASSTARPSTRKPRPRLRRRAPTAAAITWWSSTWRRRITFAITS